MYLCNINEIQSKGLDAIIEIQSKWSDEKKLEEKLKELDIDSNTIERFKDVVYSGKNAERGEADVYAKILKLLCDDNIAKCLRYMHFLSALACILISAKAEALAERDAIYTYAEIVCIQIGSRPI